jgi:predicted RNA-binding Zn-ribbon protein involved in translation (DUF1610 family)
MVNYHLNSNCTREESYYDYTCPNCTWEGCSCQFIITDINDLGAFSCHCPNCGRQSHLLRDKIKNIFKS